MLILRGIHLCKDRNVNLLTPVLQKPRFSYIFSVKSSLVHITVLEWDQSGRYLLIGDSNGNAEVWTMSTHLLNEWTRVAHINIPDEPIQAGIFFYNGKQVFFFVQIILDQTDALILFLFVLGGHQQPKP